MKFEHIEIIDIFKERSSMVGVVLHIVPNMNEALKYAVNICEKSKVCEILAQDNRVSYEEKTQKILAAPFFDEKSTSILKAMCEEKNILCLDEGLHSYLGGVNVGVAVADYGIAASGTCVVNCQNPDKRLATMICETSILILDVKYIRYDLTDITDYMRDNLKSSTPSTITYITGPSRTSDIERVLTVGVHGPLELHVVLIEHI